MSTAVITSAPLAAAQGSARLRTTGQGSARLRTTGQGSARLRTTGQGSARLRLTRRGRAVLAALAIVPALVGIGVLGAGVGEAVATSQSAGTSFDYITVDAGESLWSIAEGLAPDSDPREVVSEIISLNQLESSSVSAGQRLAIPSRYAAQG